MTKTGLRLGALALALAMGALVMGCGGSDSPEDVAADFYSALSDRDAEAFCGTLSASAAQSAADDEDVETCEQGTEKAFASGDADEALAATEGVELGEATIDGDTATVPTTSAQGQEGETPLVKEDDEWKVDVGD